MEKVHERLREAREARGITAQEAAEAMGINYNTYRQHENGIRGVKRDSAIRYARFYRVSLNWLLTATGEMRPNAPDFVPTSNIPVKGIVQAGVWREYDDADGEKFKDVIVPSHPAQAPDGQYALRVEGDSMNELVNDGQYVQCVAFGDYRGGLEDKMVVVVRRERDQTYELTLKELRLRPNGEPMQLWPRSTNPRFQEPIDYTGDEDSDVKIEAVVLGAFVNFAPEK